MGSDCVSMPQFSKRIKDTDAPVIAFTRKAMALNPDVISLAQGVTWWQPPPEALAAASTALSNPSINLYGPNEGLPELREALRTKLRERNGLQGYDVCITHGANQAFVNLVLALVDEQDPVVVFSPVYFDHLMTLTQTGGSHAIEFGPCDPHTLHPDIDWLESIMAAAKPPRMVVVCNPCNPTGALLTKEELERISLLCQKAKCWLVCDNTYEDFVFGGREHHCPSGPHIIHIFSFSKAYGMMGWRVGYLAYPLHESGQDSIGPELLKCQDTICICATQLSQHVALAALTHGQEYVKEKVQGLKVSRALLLDALSPLGPLGGGKVAGGEGGIYFFAKLPWGWDDERAVAWLVKEAGVCVVPGSACNAPGWIRCSFGNLHPDRMVVAAARLKEGLKRLVDQGPREALY